MHRVNEIGGRRWSGSFTTLIRSAREVLSRWQSSDHSGADPDHFVRREFELGRDGQQVCLVMFGFDRFDEFAEEHGAGAAGEAVLEFSRILRATARQSLVSARTGWMSDCFLVALSGADFRTACEYVDAVRAAVGAGLPEVDAGISMWSTRLASPEAFVYEAQCALTQARRVRRGYDAGAGAVPAGVRGSRSELVLAYSI